MSDTTSPISEPLHDLLRLFAEHLAEVRFGDIDKGVLEAQAARVLMAAQAAEEAQAALDAARSALTAAQQTLLVTGQRALAYARIYAETSPELLGRLNVVSLGPGTPLQKAREVEMKVARRRPRKDAEDEMPALPGTVGESSVMAATASA
ncbi:MAG: hypothetical protein SF187_01570 [Deltaproteobacteria bacterium]|nr:hypothetical protein [Deltaproteobacteria bacterium]